MESLENTTLDQGSGTDDQGHQNEDSGENFFLYEVELSAGSQGHDEDGMQVASAVRHDGEGSPLAAETIDTESAEDCTMNMECEEIHHRSQVDREKTSHTSGNADQGERSQAPSSSVEACMTFDPAGRSGVVEETDPDEPTRKAESRKRKLMVKIKKLDAKDVEEHNLQLDCEEIPHGVGQQSLECKSSNSGYDTDDFRQDHQNSHTERASDDEVEEQPVDERKVGVRIRFCFKKSSPKVSKKSDKMEENMNPQCSRCLQYFRHKRSLIGHRKRFGDTCKRESSNSGFHTDESMQDDQDSPTDRVSKGEVESKVCSVRLRDDSSSVTEMFDNKEDNINPQCPRCLKYFRHKRSLVGHRKRFGDMCKPAKTRVRREGNFRCEVCKKKYCHLRAIKVHVATSHNSEFLPRCLACGRYFREQRHLTYHRKNYPDGICKLKFQAPQKATRKQKLQKKWYESQQHLEGVSEDASCEGIHMEKMTLGSHGESLCHVCGKSLPDGSLLQHMKNHRQTKINKCDKCGQEFDRHHDFLLHMKRHEGKEVYKCDFCTACFSTRKRYKIHFKTHPEFQEYKCDACSFWGISEENLAQHTRNYHSNPTLNVCRCDFCGKYFREENLKRHKVKKHNGDTTAFRCCVCLIYFKNRDLLDEHVKICKREERSKEARADNFKEREADTFEDTRADTCKEREAVFENATNVNLREPKQARLQRDVDYSDTSSSLCDVQETVSSDCVASWKCDVCPADFQEKGSLREHLGTHCDTVPNRCPMCRIPFTSDAELTLHAKTHPQKYVKMLTAQTDPSLLRCEICDHGFLQQPELVLHTRIHRGLEIFKCSQCFLCFAKHRKLKDHFQRVHPDQTWDCDLCVHRFLSEDELSLHKKCHINEKKKKNRKGESDSLRCHFCLDRFQEKAALGEHLHTHSGDTHHQCDMCTMCFTNDAELEIHKKIHPPDYLEELNAARMNSDAVACEICDHEFLNRLALNLHMRLHQGLKVYTCVVCFKCMGSSRGLTRHRGTHTDMVWRCDVCAFRFTTKESMLAHKKECHETQLELSQCSVCLRYYQCLRSLKGHLTKIHGISNEQLHNYL